MERHVSLSSVKWLISLKRLQIQTICKRELNNTKSCFCSSVNQKCLLLLQLYQKSISTLLRNLAEIVRCLACTRTVPFLECHLQWECQIIITNSNLKGSEKINHFVMGLRMFLPFGITTRFGFPRFKYFG